MSGRDSSRLGDTADTELERRRRDEGTREAASEQRREQVAEQLDLEPEQLERRQFDDRGEDIGFVPTDEGRDELREDRAADDPFVEPRDLDVEAGRGGTRVRIDEDRRDVVGQRAAEDIASDDPFVEPDDLDAEVSDRGVTDVTLREDRQDAVADRAAEDIASDDPFVEAADLDVAVDESGVQDARIAEGRRDAVGERARQQVADDGEFIERDDVTVDVGERGIEDIDVDESAQRRSVADAIDEDTPVDIGTGDLERDGDAFALRDSAQREVAVAEIDDDTPIDIGTDDVERTDDGFALRDSAQREVAAAEIDDELDADIGTRDIVETDDGFGLRESVQRELAADDIEDALADDIRDEAPDFLQDFAARGDDPERVGGSALLDAISEYREGDLTLGEVRQVQEAFSDGERVPTVEGTLGDGLDADDIEQTDDGFALSDDVREDFAAREIDAELPEVDIDGEHVDLVTVEEPAIETNPGFGDPADPIERTEARLTDDAQQRVAEHRLDELASDLEDSDDVLFAPGLRDEGPTPENVLFDMLRDVQQGDIGSQADVGSVVGTGVNIPTSPSTIIEDADPELAEDLLGVDADRVREAQDELEAREEILEDDPQEALEGIAERTDRFAEQVGVVEDRLARGRASRQAAREAADDLESDFAAEQGVDESEVDVDIDFADPDLPARAELSDDVVERRQRAAAADELGVEPDQLEAVDGGFEFSDGTTPAEAREQLVDEIDDQTLAHIDSGDVAFDESGGRIEAELTDTAIDREREAFGERVTYAEQAFGGVNRSLEARRAAAADLDVDATDLEIDDGSVVAREPAGIGDPTRAPGLDDAAGFQLDAIDARDAAVDEFRSEAADDFGVRESDVEIGVEGDELVARPDETGSIDTSAGVDAIPFAGSGFGFDDIRELDRRDVRPALSREADQLGDAVDRATITPRPDTTPGARAVDAVRDFETADISDGIGDIGSDGPSAGESLVAVGAAGVVTPEPGTTAGGAALATIGAGALAIDAARRTEIELPERGALIGGGVGVGSEIDTPEHAERRAELDVGTGDTEIAEIDTPSQAVSGTAEIDVPDRPTDTTSEIGVPSIDAQQLIGREQFVDEGEITSGIGEEQTVIEREDLEDTGPLVDIPAEEQQRQIREELERRQEYVREDVDHESVDHEPFRFPGDATSTVSEPAGERLEAGEPSLPTDVGSGGLQRDFAGGLDTDDVAAQTPLDVPARSDLDAGVPPAQTRNLGDVAQRQATGETAADAITSGALDAGTGSASGARGMGGALPDTDLGADTAPIARTASAVDVAPVQAQAAQPAQDAASAQATVAEPIAQQLAQPTETAFEDVFVEVVETGTQQMDSARPRRPRSLDDDVGDDGVGLGALDADVEDVVEPTRGLDAVDADIASGVIDDGV